MAEEDENCDYEKIQEQNAILVKKRCRREAGKMEGLILQTIQHQEQMRLSYEEKTENFQRTQIIRSMTKDLGVVISTRSWIMTKSPSGVPSPGDDGIVQGQVSRI